ncbi:TetR family transcriptional regulator [Kutzneria viridogrisea]|uniref:HTH tetR-type domain-containing protein n=2 Tax=Kutzneria TaxID=43356 RepID=W5W9L7_9PSEU|nr:TetR family transcriptional regulator [Kutzneria albida]AHH97818.1 hypothetical protein KALB_4456 [Kutzneria albida DSM 43870]MBA8924595.1 AcrR family transcriptional regulator [Kutzneria viridogrisea]
MKDLCGLRERKKQRTRAALVDAALDLFERKGFEATTVEEIAAAAEVSPRTFFRYFTAKEGAVLAVQEEEYQALLTELATRPGDLRGALLAVVDRGGQDGRSRRVQELVAATPALRATSLDRSAAQERELAEQLVPRSATEQERLRARLAVAVTFSAIRVAVECWLATPGTPCSQHVLAALAVLDEPR